MAQRVIELLDDKATTGAGDTFNVALPEGVNQPVAPFQAAISNTAGDVDIQVKFQGRIDANSAWVDLDFADHSTAANIDAGGSNVSSYGYVEIMPQMRVNLHEATTTGAGYAASIKVFASQVFGG